MSEMRAISTNLGASCHQIFFFLQDKAPKEIHIILTETLACTFLVGLRTYQDLCIDRLVLNMVETYEKHTEMDRGSEYKLLHIPRELGKKTWHISWYKSIIHANKEKGRLVLQALPTSHVSIYMNFMSKNFAL